MNKFGELSSGQDKHRSVDHGRRRKMKLATFFKPFSILLTLQVKSSNKIKKKTTKFEAKVKREAKKQELLSETTKSQARKIEKLLNGCIKLKEDVSWYRLVGYAQQNDRMKETEKLLSNICLTDVMRLLVEAESDVRAPAPPTTSAFQ